MIKINFLDVVTWIGVIIYFLLLNILGVMFLTKGQDIDSLRGKTEDPVASDILDQDSKNIKAVAYLMFCVAVMSFIGLICMFK